MRTVDEINEQIAVHRENIERMKEQIDALTFGVAEEDPLEDMNSLEEEILEEWGAIRELEAERDAI